jgi:hypothetical protein
MPFFTSGLGKSTSEDFKIDPIKLDQELRRRAWDAPPVEEFSFSGGEYSNYGHSILRQTTVLSLVGDWVSKLTCKLPGAVGKRVRPTPATLIRNVMSARHGGVRLQLKGARGRVVDVLNPLGISNGRG